MQIEIKSLRSSNQNLLKQVKFLEEKFTKDFNVLRNLIHEKTVYVNDVHFTRM